MKGREEEGEGVKENGRGGRREEEDEIGKEKRKNRRREEYSIRYNIIVTQTPNVNTSSTFKRSKPGTDTFQTLNTSSEYK